MLLYRFDSKHRCYCMPYNCPFLKKGGRFHRQSVSIFAWGGEPWSFSSPRLRLRATWSHHHPKVTSRIASCFLDCLRAFFPTLFFVILSSGIYTIIYSCKYIRWCPQQKSPIYFTTTNLFQKKIVHPGYSRKTKDEPQKIPYLLHPPPFFSIYFFWVKQTPSLRNRKEAHLIRWKFSFWEPQTKLLARIMASTFRAFGSRFSCIVLKREKNSCGKPPQNPNKMAGAAKFREEMKK